MDDGMPGRKVATMVFLMALVCMTTCTAPESIYPHSKAEPGLVFLPIELNI